MQFGIVICDISKLLFFLLNIYYSEQSMLFSSTLLTFGKSRSVDGKLFLKKGMRLKGGEAKRKW